MPIEGPKNHYQTSITLHPLPTTLTFLLHTSSFILSPSVLQKVQEFNIVEDLLVNVYLRVIPINNSLQNQNFRSCRWWSLLTGPRMRDLPLSPPSTLAEIFRCTCLQSCLKLSTPTHKKSYTKFQNPRKIFDPMFTQIRPFQGGRGVPEVFIGILIFL